MRLKDMSHLISEDSNSMKHYHLSTIYICTITCLYLSISICHLPIPLSNHPSISVSLSKKKPKQNNKITPFTEESFLINHHHCDNIKCYMLIFPIWKSMRMNSSLTTLKPVLFLPGCEGQYISSWHTCVCSLTMKKKLNHLRERHRQEGIDTTKNAKQWVSDLINTLLSCSWRHSTCSWLWMSSQTLDLEYGQP